MLLSKKIITLFFCIVMIAMTNACGFQPLHQKNKTTVATDRALSDISIALIPDRDGQYLRNALIDRLYLNGDPKSAKYILKINTLDKSVTNMGLQKDATFTRGEMNIRAQMALIDQTTGQVVLERSMRTVGGFNLLDNQFATLVSEENLTDHLLEEIADHILNDLHLYFHRQAG